MYLSDSDSKDFFHTHWYNRFRVSDNLILSIHDMESAFTTIIEPNIYLNYPGTICSTFGSTMISIDTMSFCPGVNEPLPFEVMWDTQQNLSVDEIILLTRISLGLEDGEPSMIFGKQSNIGQATAWGDIFFRDQEYVSLFFNDWILTLTGTERFLYSSLLAAHTSHVLAPLFATTASLVQDYIDTAWHRDGQKRTKITDEIEQKLKIIRRRLISEGLWTDDTINIDDGSTYNFGYDSPQKIWRNFDPVRREVDRRQAASILRGQQHKYVLSRK